MRCKKNHRAPKKLPYGAAKGRYWCMGCDGALVPEWYNQPKKIKKRARREAKKQIKDILKED